MKSAYGLKIPEPDPELTRVGPGTPCGELMRRYWQPVCLSADLKDVPKPVRILGEDLIAFRDGQGRAGLLFFRCSHRGTSLEYGRVEERGLRCCYHGWLYDVEGKILEMPLEPANNPFLKQIQHPCYPVREFGGLVFAYMGPLDKQPEFPVYDIWKEEGGILKARMGPRVGGPVNCNWLQAEENLMDALHTFWLHTLHSGTQFPSPVYGMNPDELKYEETAMGMRFVLTRKLPTRQMVGAYLGNDHAAQYSSGIHRRTQNRARARSHLLRSRRRCAPAWRQHPLATAWRPRRTYRTRTTGTRRP